MVLIEGKQPFDVDVAHAVAKGHYKAIVVEVFLDAPDAASGHGVDAGFGESDAKVLFLVMAVVLDLRLLAEAMVKSLFMAL